MRGERPKDKNSIQGYCLKADIFHYFDNVDHEILIKIIERKVNDKNLIWLIRQILENFNTPRVGRGMPLGNYTSQFFANVYLNELDYFVKHILKVKYYIRYVDDFVILHRSKNKLEYFRKRISIYLSALGLKLHPDKTEVTPLQKGINFLGYKIFYKYKILRKRNRRYFLRKLEKDLKLYEDGWINESKILSKLQGWTGYAQWANTYKLRKEIIKRVEEVLFKR